MRLNNDTLKWEEINTSKREFIKTQLNKVLVEK